MNLSIKIILISTLLLFSWNCKEKGKRSKYGCVNNKYDEAPNQVMSFSYNNNQSIYALFNADSTKDSLALGYKNNLIYYLQGTTKIYVQYVILTRISPDLHSQYFLSTGEILMLSYGSGIKQFYIDWPNGQKDSLYVDYIQDDSKDNFCCCQYPLQAFKINNRSFVRKTDFDKNGIYIFDR